MITFDNFYSLDCKERKRILNDIEEIKLLVKNNIKESRYLHSLSVAETARKLARIHSVDENKAYIAGVLHDCAKYLSDEELDNYLKFYDPEKLNMPIGTKHSFVAKYYIKEKLNYHDTKVLNAIYNHTICNSRDKLSLILYIADKREPLRKIEDNILDIAYKDLYKAYDLLNIDVKEYIEANNEQYIKSDL